MVLVKKPGLSAKVRDSWKGLFEVLQITPVTREFYSSTRHVNMLKHKRVHTAEILVSCRVVV